jgi:hypothetical protein
MRVGILLAAWRGAMDIIQHLSAYRLERPTYLADAILAELREVFWILPLGACHLGAPQSR